MNARKSARHTSSMSAALWVTAMAGILVAAAASADEAADDRVFVPLGSAGAIVVISAEDDSLVRRIEGLPAVHGLAGTPDGAFLIAGSYDERPTGEPPTKPAEVSEEDHLAHHTQDEETSGVPTDVVSTVSVVRIVDGEVVRRIDVPGSVHHVAVSPDGRFAAFTHPYADAVSVIDLDAAAVVATVATGPLPNFAAFAPDGKALYVSNAGNATVSEIDTARWYVRRNILVGATPEHLVIDREGQRLFVNNVDHGTVSIVALADGTVVETLEVGDTLHGLDLADDGRTLYVADLGEERVVSIDLTSGERREIALSPSPYHLAFVRGHGKLYVSSADDPKIWVLDAGSLAVRGEIAIGGKGHQMVQVRAP
ncbi:MAG: YncE family protein [Alphaproteobacteria bacterium]